MEPPLTAVESAGPHCSWSVMFGPNTTRTHRVRQVPLHARGYCHIRTMEGDALSITTQCRLLSVNVLLEPPPGAPFSSYLSLLAALVDVCCPSPSTTRSPNQSRQTGRQL